VLLADGSHRVSDAVRTASAKFGTAEPLDDAVLGHDGS